MGEHLAHGVTVQTEDTGCLPDAHAVYYAGSSDAQIQFHPVHPSHLPWGRVVPYERWRTVQFSTAVHRRSSRPSGTLLLRRLHSRLAGYEDTNDAERLAQDPTMRIIVGRRDTDRPAASTNTMSRFETEVLTQDGNMEGLDRLNAEWVDGAMSRTPHRRVILDMDSSESPVHGEQEGAAYNGHFGSMCYHPLFVFNQFGDCEGAMLRAGNVHSAHRLLLLSITVLTN